MGHKGLGASVLANGIILHHSVLPNRHPSCSQRKQPRLEFLKGPCTGVEVHILSIGCQLGTRVFSPKLCFSVHNALLYCNLL